MAILHENGASIRNSQSSGSLAIVGRCFMDGAFAEQEMIAIMDRNQDSIPASDVESHWQREHYIPIPKEQLIERLASRLKPNDKAPFLELCRLIDTTFQLEFQQILRKLKDAYSSVDPDPETQILNREPRSQKEAKVECLFDEVEGLLTRANFQRLSSDEIEKATGSASDWGVKLNVDLELFDRLEVFARGDIVDQRDKRRWFGFRKTVVDVPIYKRIVTIFRMKTSVLHDRCENDIVYLKLLKNVPKDDLDMMLPGSRVKMSLLDRGRIMLPTLSGLFLAVLKFFKGAVILAYVGIYGLIALLGFIFGTLSYGLKSFFGYRQIKTKYEYNLTKNLYFQHIDSNAGVLFRLVDEGYEQDLRETVLGYFLLWQRTDEKGVTLDELDAIAETELLELTGIDIDFEVDDAMTKLRRFELVQESDEGRLTATRLHRAIRCADRRLHEFLP